MKYISYNLDFKINPSISLISEQQILDLQEVFLTNGFHYITVPTIKEGRSLIYTFLDALRCFKSVACITKNKSALQKDVFDIQGYLELCGFNKADQELFFIEDFDFDFVWIEFYKNESWHTEIEHKIQEIGIDQQIPIILLIADK